MAQPVLKLPQGEGVQPTPGGHGKRYTIIGVATAGTMVVLNALLDAMIGDGYRAVFRYAWHFLAHIGWGHLILDAIFLLVIGILARSTRSWRGVAIEQGATIEEISVNLAESNETIEVAFSMLNFFGRFASDMEQIIEEGGALPVLKDVIKLQLRAAQEIFGDGVYRAYVLVPDGEFLRTFVAEQMPEPDGYERAFYIGPDSRTKRGIAGAAFVRKEVIVCHARPDRDRWTFDHPDYLELDNTGRLPAYRSFIAVPMMTSRERCIGVVCMDSPNADAFDNSNVQDLVVHLGFVMARTITLAQLMQRKNQAAA